MFLWFDNYRILTSSSKTKRFGSFWYICVSYKRFIRRQSWGRPSPCLQRQLCWWPQSFSCQQYSSPPPPSPHSGWPFWWCNSIKHNNNNARLLKCQHLGDYFEPNLGKSDRGFLPCLIGIWPSFYESISMQCSGQREDNILNFNPPETRGTIISKTQPALYSPDMN